MLPRSAALAAALLALAAPLAAAGDDPTGLFSGPFSLNVTNQVQATRSDSDVQVAFGGFGTLTGRAAGVPSPWPWGAAVAGTTSGTLTYQDASGVHYLSFSEPWSATTGTFGSYRFTAYAKSWPFTCGTPYIYDVTTQASAFGATAQDTDGGSGAFYCYTNGTPGYGT